MACIELPYGHRTLPVTFPDSWLGEIATPRPVNPAQDAASLVRAALHNPTGTAPLPELVKPGHKIALIIDDYTRKTPVDLLLPPILEQLLATGVARDDIRIVIALGTHRPMAEGEIVAKVSAEITAQYQIVNTPSTNRRELVYLGKASNGIPAWVNRTVAEADVRIGLGMITPHLETGFTGGAKIVLPGVCGAATVDAFHTASAFIPENYLGNVDAPLRQSLEQFVAERAPLHFILNVITTPGGELYQCVAGHPVEAHRAGVEHARTVFGTPVQRRYPVVVANCYPYDFDLWQSIKGIWAGDLLTEDGGTLIAVTAAPEGNSNYPLVPGYAGREPETLKREIETGQVEDGKQAATGVMFGRLKQRVNLLLVSDGLTPTDAGLMGIPFYDTVEAALAAAVNRLPEARRQGAVAILPQAGIALPLVL
jgi:nickel-dependent lactate racemase